MNLQKYHFLNLFLLLAFLPGLSYSQDTIRIDFNKIMKSTTPEGAASANLCWLLDSDIKRPNPHKSFAEAINELGCGSLRFPYGHLADNYLWHTAPYDNTQNGLKPAVATKTQTPAQWDWATNEDGTFMSAMDFDEYMSLCARLNIKPLVVVNALSFKYKGGPTLNELVTSAAEWVKYAKRKNYQVGYWQIGNEVDHHPKLISKDEYVDAYQQISAAMKAVDPNIKVGPGILSNVAFFKKIITQTPDLIDFTSCHQYLWAYKESCKNYELWKEYNDPFIPNVIKMRNAVHQSSKPDMEILITETGVSPSGQGMGNINNVYKALWWFEVLMNEMNMPNVSYIYNWGTHSPWKGYQDDESDDVSVLLRVDNNARKPTAEVIKIVNEHFMKHCVHTSNNSPYIRTYASIDEGNKECSVFLMNKNTVPSRVVLQIQNMPSKLSSLNFSGIQGENPLDKNFEESTKMELRVLCEVIAEVVIPALSIAVLHSN
ncbi:MULTISPECIES: hypothetical protein [unclassified Carboxylicivirga]|uniref:hypothetical protein n=1 Tax=Carboxylicivirga TaxID=1628153 RepID=UPI003D3595E6